MVTVKTGDEVSITGDFFIEPPEALEEVRKALEEGEDREQILNALESIDAEFIGFSPEHVVEAFMEAREG